MKKVITMLLVGLMLIGGTIAAYAEEPSELSTEALLEKGAGAGILKEFTEEMHQLNDLRMERNQLEIQLIGKRDQLIELRLDAKEEGNKEALEAARKEREQIKATNEGIKALHDQAAEAREAFREAVRAKDSEKAGEELDKLINAVSSINEKLENKVEVLNTVIDILS
ncbi:MAG TPA: hypothetical protein VN549_01650 [Negativicutes bacterium]|nr:hypothetical protein [Negativicutes bacterium]